MKKCKQIACKLFNYIPEVPYSGNTSAKVVLVGESPGKTEEFLGKPFVGKSRELLDECFSEIGLEWNDFFILNSARCKINKKDLTQKEIRGIISCCRPKVEYVLKKLNPKLIVVLGDIALLQILKKSGITKQVGSFIWSKEFDCWVLCAFHPAHILRKQYLKKRFISDIRLIKDFIDNDYNIPTSEINREYLDVDITPKNMYSFKQNVSTWLKLGESIGIDTEAQGLDVYDQNFVFISYSVSSSTNSGHQVRLYEECSKEECTKIIQWMRCPEGKKKKILTVVYLKKSPNYDLKIALLKLILAASNIKKYVMGSFDRHAFSTVGLRDQKSIIDIQALANVIDENLYSMASLDDLRIGFTDFNISYKNEFAKKHDKGDMLLADTQDRLGVTQYACADADVTRQCGLSMRDWFLKNKKQLRYASKFTIPVCSILYDMEHFGVCIDVDKLPQITKEISSMANAAEKAALYAAPKKIKEKHKEAGLKLTRDLLVQDVLFNADGFKLFPPKKTKTGYSIDKGTRQKLLDRKLPKSAFTFIKKYEEWSKCHTLVTRYLAGFRNYIKDDGRVHAQTTLAVTRTGRTNSKNPNMENNPKRSDLAHKIRQLIVSKPGYIFLTADMAQSELRWMAHMANDQEMIRVFNADEDIHTNTAKSLAEKSGRIWAQLSDTEKEDFRRSAKSINFGLMYGMSVNGFIKYAKLEYGIDLSYAEAEKWIYIFFRVLYKQILNYHAVTIDLCKKYGYVDSPLGRRRRLQDIYSEDDYLRGFAERQAINHPIQSASSDTVLLVANEIKNKYNFDPMDFRTILFIHDELIFEVKDDSKVMDYAKIVKTEMENPPLYRDFGVRLKVPMKADIKYGYNLGGLKKISIC